MEEHPLEWALSEGPIGYWSTHRGTFDIVMQEDYVFFPNGSGVYRSFDAMLGSFVTKFLWKFEVYGKIRFFTFNFPFELDEALDFNNPDDWQFVEYCGGWIKHTDISSNIPVLLLCSRDESGKVADTEDYFGTLSSGSLDNGGIAFGMKIDEFLQTYSEESYLNP